ncbi:MAG: DEAD/DEAH box helicase, partial [Planctomycetaceae bacterium]|nr:DEAD/DEAH box helicase [Planctomycetaceae bacterium]
MRKDLFSDIDDVIKSEEHLKVAYHRTYQGQDAEYVSPARVGLHPLLVSYVNLRYPSGLFTHQADAIKAILSGKNTVVATKTSSGKSLLFTLPIFNAHLNDPNSTALFIYPQNALANDQLSKLTQTDRILGRQEFFQAADNSFFMAIVDHILNLLTPDDLVHPGFELTH